MVPVEGSFESSDGRALVDAAIYPASGQRSARLQAVVSALAEVVG